jgi:conjugative relaxase-like TrwC/TraI family protein
MVTIGHVYETLDKYAKDNYFSRGAESPGQWHGKGAEMLGLKGDVKNEDYQSVREGKDPRTGEQLVSLASNGKHRDGYDIQFALPKGLSLLREFGTHEIRAAIDRAHNRAVDRTMKMIEKDYIMVRETHNGETKLVATGNAVWGKFGHDISRELDPQGHIHCPVANMSYNPNTGKWQAIESKVLYDNKMFIGQYSRNESSLEIKRELEKIGYKIEYQTDAKGLYDITLFSDDEKQLNSRRTEQINAKVQELKERGLYQGLNEQKLREIACLGSRAAKKDVDMDMVREDIKKRNAEIGVTEKVVMERLERASEQAKQNESNRTEPKMTEYDIVRQAAKIRTEQESTFRREDILKTAGKLSIGEYRMSDLEKAFNELSKDKEIKQLDKNVYTTKEMQKIEKEIVEKVKSGHDSKDAIMSKEQVEQGIKDFETRKGFVMTQDQKAAVSHILTSKDRIIGIQGDAGTGKTTMLANVREQLEKQGYEVRGLSFTGKAASEIEQASGIKSQTIDSFLASKNIEAGRKEVWVVDEASMVGSRRMHELVKSAEKADAKIVMVGDTKQLQAIGAGKAFKDLQENGMKTVRMSEVQRQREEGYRDVVRDISEKKIDKAFNNLERQNRIAEIANRNERFDAIKNDYVNSKRNTIIVTARNADRNDLNNRIHDSLKEKGKIGKTEHTFTVRESKNLSPIEKHFAQSYTAGDRIVAGKAGLIGRAGAEGKVTEVDQLNHKITVQTRNGKEMEIDLKTQGQHLAVYSEKQQSFCIGEKVVFMKNDKGRGIQNGQTGTMKNIDKDGNAKVEMESGKTKDINLRTQYNYIDRGYAVTDYKSQGQTASRVIYHADTSKDVNYNQSYVAMTRGKEDLKVYTDSKENMKEQMKHEQVKSSTLSYEKVEQQKQHEAQKQRGGMSL